jgi:hypothetical protein
MTYVKNTKGKSLLVYAEYIFEKDYTKMKKHIGNASNIIYTSVVDGYIQ